MYLLWKNLGSSGTTCKEPTGSRDVLQGERGRRGHRARQQEGLLQRHSPPSQEGGQGLGQSNCQGFGEQSTAGRVWSLKLRPQPQPWDTRWAPFCLWA